MVNNREIRNTIYDIRYTSYANRRNTPNPDATPNKSPIWPKLSTNYDLFMQNKANLPDDQMNVNKVLTKDYENIANCKLCENKPKQSQSKPISKAKKCCSPPFCCGRSYGENYVV